MPIVRATRRASSEASVPQQEPKRGAPSASGRVHTFMVTPTTSKPCSTSSAAATDESTPPDMPTTMRSRVALMASVSLGEQGGQALELLGIGVDDLDLAALVGAGDAHARHERALQPVLERGELSGAAAARLARQPSRARRFLGGANGVLGGAHRPRVREDFLAQPELIAGVRQRKQRARVAHGE